MADQNEKLMIRSPITHFEDHPRLDHWGAGKTVRLAILACGHVGGGDSEWDNDAKRLRDLEVGEERICTECSSIEGGRARLPEIVAHPDLSHTRSDPRSNAVRVYRYDRTSPTGVTLLTSFHGSLYGEFCDLARKSGRSHLTPLSPTERR